MDAQAEKVLKRFNKAKKRKANWATLYEDAQEYVCPHRESFNEGDNPGQEKTGQGKVFDSTAIDAVQKFASNLQSSLVPPMRKWIELKAGPQFKDNKEDMNKVLSDASDVLFSHLQNSNFDTQIAESFQDLAIGTGALLVMKGTTTSPFRFINVPLSQLYVLEGPDGRPDTAYREWKLAARNIEQQWPDAKLPKEIKEQVAEDPERLIELIEEIYPDEVSLQTVSGKKKQGGFRYSVVAKKGKHQIVSREQKSSPWIIFRWSTLPGEIYGRGPALIALPDVKTLNKTKELLLQSASISIFGMWLGDSDSVVNLENIKFSPGTIIPQDRLVNGSPALVPLNSSSDLNLAQIVIQDLQNSVRNMLFADPLGPIDLPVKSATEVSLRQQELAKRIGSAFGRLQFELIQPLVNRCLDILEELGLVDLAELRVDGTNLAIEHVSPLAQAQAEEETLAIMRYLEMLAGLYGPEALQIAAPLDKTITEVGPRLNVPTSMIPSSTEIKDAQAKAQLAQLAQAGGQV